MEPLQFNESGYNNFNDNPEEKGMAGMLVRWGVAKDYKSAEMILLVFALVLIAISIYLFANNL